MHPFISAPPQSLLLLRRKILFTISRASHTPHQIHKNTKSFQTDHLSLPLWVFVWWTLGSVSKRLLLFSSVGTLGEFRFDDICADGIFLYASWEVSSAFSCVNGFFPSSIRSFLAPISFLFSHLLSTGGGRSCTCVRCERVWSTRYFSFALAGVKMVWVGHGV